MRVEKITNAMFNRTFEIKPYNGGRSLPCFDCPVRRMCERLNENGNIKPTIDNSQIPIKNPILKIEQRNPMVDLACIDPEVGELYRLMEKCKRELPAYTIVDCGERQPQTKYTLVSKRGDKIFSANSFGSFIIQIIITTLGAALFIMIIGGIVCGIASIFE